MNYLNQTVLFLVFFLLFGCAVKTPQYKGEMKDGNKHGTGTLTYPDGSEYIGEFKDDHRILSIEDYKKLAEENNILITGDYIYLLAAYGGAPEPDNLSHYYNFNNALGIANDVYRRGLRYVFSPKSPSKASKTSSKIKPSKPEKFASRSPTLTSLTS